MMVNAIKKLFNITLQNPAGFGVVFADYISVFSELIECFVSSFIDAAGVRVGDECVVKEWIEYSVDSTMQQTVTNRRFTDQTRFRVRDMKLCV